MMICFFSFFAFFMVNLILYFISDISSLDIVIAFGIVTLIYATLIAFFNKIHYSRSFPWILSVA